ncbi:MAG: hypothetical protein AB8B81_19640 [Halioglobus sp.]
MTACEKIDRLVTSYDQDFQPVRGRSTSDRFMNIWEAKVDAVGNSCEIWQTGEGKTSYVCTRVAPNEGVARQWFDSDVNNINTCLSGWTREDLPRKDGPGLRTVWSEQDKNPQVSAHVLPTRGAFKEHWTLYYFVGDRDDRF